MFQHAEDPRKLSSLLGNIGEEVGIDDYLTDIVHREGVTEMALADDKKCLEGGLQCRDPSRSKTTTDSNATNKVMSHYTRA